MLQPEKTVGETDWFVHDRFGMFIHWGTYALAARHEWVQKLEKLDEESYRKYFEHFDPDLYDPKAWAKAAREAGMKYFVITTKHHEGFCLWDSAFTDFKAPNSPAGRDLLTPMVEAFRAEGIRVGFYYSLIDWHHPHFPIDNIHPLGEHPDALEMNKSRDVKIYAEYLHNQVRELLTNFGEIDVLWFDFSYPNHPQPEGMKGKGRDDWNSEVLMKMIRELQPKAMVNNRLDLEGVVADMHTPEQVEQHEWVRVDGEPVVWEACHTFSGSWGYFRDEATWKSPQQLIRLLVTSVANGGNLLMNVGPTGRGTFDPRALSALGVYRDWIHFHARSIYGCTQSKFPAPDGCRYTQSGKRLYLHFLNWPFSEIHLPELGGKVEYAQLLHDSSQILFKENGHFANDARYVPTPEGAITLSLPIVQPDVVVPVIELFLK